MACGEGGGEKRAFNSVVAITAAKLFDCTPK